MYLELKLKSETKTDLAIEIATSETPPELVFISKMNIFVIFYKHIRLENLKYFQNVKDFTNC